MHFFHDLLVLITVCFICTVDFFDRLLVLLPVLSKLSKSMVYISLLVTNLNLHGLNPV